MSCSGRCGRSAEGTAESQLDCDGTSLNIRHAQWVMQEDTSVLQCHKLHPAGKE